MQADGSHDPRLVFFVENRRGAEQAVPMKTHSAVLILAAFAMLPACTTTEMKAFSQEQRASNAKLMRQSGENLRRSFQSFGGTFGDVAVTPKSGLAVVGSYHEKSSWGKLASGEIYRSAQPVAVDGKSGLLQTHLDVPSGRHTITVTAKSQWIPPHLDGWDGLYDWRARGTITGDFIAGRQYVVACRDQKHIPREGGRVTFILAEKASSGALVPVAQAEAPVRVTPHPVVAPVPFVR
jgi:hypothetical protein